LVLVIPHGRKAAVAAAAVEQGVAVQAVALPAEHPAVEHRAAALQALAQVGPEQQALAPQRAQGRAESEPAEQALVSAEQVPRVQLAVPRQPVPPERRIEPEPQEQPVLIPTRAGRAWARATPPALELVRATTETSGSSPPGRTGRTVRICAPERMPKAIPRKQTRTGSARRHSSPTRPPVSS